MIIVKVVGGLGNQMFQFANGLAVAKRNNTTCKLDITSFRNYTLHNYSLDHFRILPEVASASELRRFHNQPIHSLLKKKISSVFARSSSPTVHGYVKEQHFNFIPEILDLKGSDFYLDGYWQSEKYFIDIADNIRYDFQVRDEPVDLNKDYVDKIKSSESVCVHIRRGDYVKNKQTQAVHGAPALNYYYTALESIAKQTNAINVFVFSDDPAWVKEHLHTQYPTTYVTHNGPDRNYEDLRLMSTCKHHVIANSTFSWWGAWLAQTNKQIVVAPKKWFNTGTSSADLIPDRWIRM